MYIYTYVDLLHIPLEIDRGYRERDDFSKILMNTHCYTYARLSLDSKRNRGVVVYGRYRVIVTRQVADATASLYLSVSLYRV